MTRHDQQIALATHMGWTKIRMTIRGAGAPERGKSPYGVPPGRAYETSLPTYDLNEMHEAEKTLAYHQHRAYWTQLSMYTAGVGMFPGEATAAQRAEAFLRTIGKWTP